MRVLVTGAAGFIGSELVRQLVAAGRQVTALDNFSTGRPENLAGIPLEIVEGDVRDPQVSRGVSVVYHLACLGVRHSLRAPEETHEVNATGTLRLLEAARAAAVERFVHVSSCEVYGTAQTVPMGEDHPAQPRTVYGASKLAGEAYARAFHLSHGFPSVVVRPFSAYGPRCHHEGDSGEVIPKFLLRAQAGLPPIVFGDGEQTRDFTYVSDTARGILLAGTAPGAIGRTFNLGSGREIRINLLARMVSEAAGQPACSAIHGAPRPGDVRRLLADATLAREVLGWRPRVSFENGLAKLVEWYARQGVPAKELLEQEVVYNWLSS